MRKFEFGRDAPCRKCHGEGERVVAMTPAEKIDHERENRARVRAGREPEKMPAKKTCPDCGGLGFVPIAVADGTAKKEIKE